MLLLYELHKAVILNTIAQYFKNILLHHTKPCTHKNIINISICILSIHTGGGGGGGAGGAGGGYLHPEEGDAGEEVHGGLEVLEAVLTACREVVLQRTTTSCFIE